MAGKSLSPSLSEDPTRFPRHFFTSRLHNEVKIWKVTGPSLIYGPRHVKEMCSLCYIMCYLHHVSSGADPFVFKRDV